MRLFGRHREDREERIAEARRAIAKQERLGRAIEWQRQEAADVSSWARKRLEANHLTELFLSTRGNP
jgi:hypothetical protein